MPHIPDSRHSDHDPLAIAAYAAGDATGDELDTAIALVAACADCAALHADLRAISAALPELPAPARPRDFRLSPEQAASIRPAGWRRFLAPLAGPKFAFAGPLGGGLAAMGIAGLLVAGSLGAPIAATPAGEGGGNGQAAEAPIEGTGPALDPVASGDLTFKGLEASSAPSFDTAQELTGPAGTSFPPGEGPVMAAPGPSVDDGTASTTRAMDSASTGPSLVLPVVSVVLVAVGLVLVGLRLAGRRLSARG